MKNKIILGDSLNVMKQMEDNSIDLIVTDPPYGISFMGKAWDKAIPSPEYWKEMLRIIKPGGHLLAAGLPKMMHRLICTIEDSGWEIRDLLMHLFGSGFPKSHNFGNKIGDDWEGYGTALKPAWECWSLAMKPLDGTFTQNVEKWGVGGINIDACRVGIDGTTKRSCQFDYPKNEDGTEDRSQHWARTGHEVESVNKGRWPANLILDDVYESVLCLKNNIPCDMISVIKEFYHDYEMPNLPKRIHNISFENKEKQRSILQQDLLLRGIENEDEGRETLHVRKESQERINTENETSSCEIRMGKSNFQGLLDEQGIQICQHSDSSERSTGNCKTNDQQKRDSGTSFNDVIKIEKTFENLGSCSSCERDKRRQQDREFRSDGQFIPQERAQGNIERVSDAERGERTIEILACDVPEKWRKYFIESGYEMKSPKSSSQMLDEQTGNLKSQGKRLKKLNNIYNGFKNTPLSDSTGYGDSGGASRFFYCPKVSSAERNRGLEDMPLKEGGVKNDSGRGFSESDPNKSIMYKNNHPTVKPIELMKYLIRLIAPPGNPLLLDPFCGSGSTCLAAKILGIDYIGIELNPEYHEIAEKRVNQIIQSEFI